MRITADRRGGAVLTQPFRPDTNVALPERALGDLLSEELRRLDPDEPYSDALEAATGVTDLADRSPVREHVWFDPAEGNGPARDRRRRLPRQAPTREPPAPDVVVEPDAEHLARAGAEALVARLAAAQAVHGSAAVVLTGGGIGIAVLEQVAALAAEPVRETVDWTAVDVWWGDERFVPAADDERNEKAARRALLDVWVFRRSGCTHAGVRRGLRRTRGRRRPGTRSTRGGRARRGGGARGFDVLLLGMGPEGHVASIFPDSPAASEDARTVVAVRDCPKPPPTRVSLGFAAINAAEEVWLLVSGRPRPRRRAGAGGRGPAELPAAGVHGRPGHPVAAGRGRRERVADALGLTKSFSSPAQVRTARVTS